MQAPHTVEFFFDVGSPASYLAWTQLPRLCVAAKASLVYRPMLLGGVFQATGNSSPGTVPAKGRYMTLDLQRFATRYGVPFMQNPFFPINTLRLMRGAVGMQMHQPERFDAYLQAIFTGMWVKGLDMGQPEVVGTALASHGIDPATVFPYLEDPAVKAALKASTDEAVQRGVFGAPTMFVADEMFFGQDRLDFIREALAQAADTAGR